MPQVLYRATVTAHKIARVEHDLRTWDSYDLEFAINSARCWTNARSPGAVNSWTPTARLPVAEQSLQQQFAAQAVVEPGAGQ